MASASFDPSRIIPWWAFVRRAHCPHVQVYGIYGDGITMTPGFRRLRCYDCGRLLDGPVSIAWTRRGTHA